MWQSIKEYIPLSLGRWLGMTIGGIGAVGTIAQVMGYTLPNMPLWAWLLIMFLGFSIAQFLAFHKIRTKLDNHENTQPNIVFGESYIWSTQRIAVSHPLTEGEHIFNIEGRQVFSNYYVLRAKVRNTPVNPMQGAEAGQAVITIDFFSEDKSDPIMTIDGRWSDNPQVGTLGLHVPIADLRKRDLLPNSDYHEIDIAVKVHEDSDWFATNDYAERQAVDGKYQPYKLPTGCILVAITIKAVGLKELSIGWIRIDNHGKDTAPTTELLN